MNDREKRLKTAAICYFLGSAGFYIAAIIGFISDSSIPATNLCLGSVLLCIGAATLRKINEQNGEE